MSTTDELRAYLGRLLGWSNTGGVAHALRSIELAREHRAQLVLCGPGDLVPLAYGLHRRAFGGDTPFIVCDPRRGNTPASVRSPANIVDAAEASTLRSVARCAYVDGDLHTGSRRWSSACAAMTACSTSVSRRIRFAGWCGLARSRCQRSRRVPAIYRGSSTSTSSMQSWSLHLHRRALFSPSATDSGSSRTR